MSEPLLSVDHLTAGFDINGRFVPAVIVRFTDLPARVTVRCGRLAQVGQDQLFQSDRIRLPARHDRCAGKMPGEKTFVHRYVLQSNYMTVAELEDFVDE